MKAKEIEALESYFKTDNEYWNDFTFEILCDALKQGHFVNPETPLHLFDFGTNLFLEHLESPLKGLKLFVVEMDKQKLNSIQRLFVLEWLFRYLKESEFEGKDLNQACKLLQLELGKLVIIEPLPRLTRDIRESLKEMIQKELVQLPESLKGLQPIQRLNILCKLIPFVLPKIESVSHDLDEPYHL